MAILKSPFPLIGKFDNLVAYHLSGVDGIVVRRKGGVSGHVVKTAPQYETARKNGSEFGGRSNASGWIMRMMHPVKELADGKIGGVLNAFLIPVQELDTESEFGKRHVMLTRNRDLLQGFSLNKESPFSSVVRPIPPYSISRDELSATVRVPELIPQINFFPSMAAPLFSIVAVLGVVPDVFYSSTGYQPSHSEYGHLAPVMSESPWHPCTERSAPFELSLQFTSTPPDEHFSLVLSVGIRYGSPSVRNIVKRKEKSGCGMIITAV
jgi:hypothetical protein